MKYIMLISALIALSMLPACHSPQPKQIDLNQIRKLIETQNKKWFEAVREYDIPELLGMYTNDATIMPPNFPMLRGIRQIKAYYERMPQRGIRITKGAFTILELSGNDSTVYEIGEYIMNIERQDSPAIADTGKYNTIWKLQEDGSWKMYADCWNSNKPLRFIQSNQ